MKTRDNTTSRTTREQGRIQAMRDRFQKARPTLEQLLETGEYEGPIRAEDAWPVDQLLSKLRHLRLQAGITQRQLAHRIGLDPTALSRLESGRQPNVTVDTLQKLAKGLGYTLLVQVEPLRKPRAA
jgi:DNA-binding Xre family transcriptional regulator